MLVSVSLFYFDYRGEVADSIASSRAYGIFMFPNSEIYTKGDANNATCCRKFSLREKEKERERKGKKDYHYRELLRNEACQNVLILFVHARRFPRAVAIFPYAVPHGIPSHIRRNVSVH